MRVNGFLYVCNDPVRRFIGSLFETGGEPFLAEELVHAVFGFGHAVGVEEEPVSLSEIERLFAVRYAVHAGKHKPAAAPDEGRFSVRDQHGRVMPRADESEFAGRDIEHADPRGDEHVGRVVAAEALVRDPDRFRKRRKIAYAVLDGRLRRRHEQRRRNALAGNVRDDDREPIPVHEEYVVEIAADLLCRIHGGGKLKLRSAGIGLRNGRQKRALDDGRNFQLRLQTRTLKRDCALLFDITDHRDHQRKPDRVDQDKRKSDRFYDVERRLERFDDQQNERQMEDLHHGAGEQRPPGFFEHFVEFPGQNAADEPDADRRDDAGVCDQPCGHRRGRTDEKPMGAGDHARDQTAQRPAGKAREHRSDVADRDDCAVQFQTGHGAVDPEDAPENSEKNRIFPADFGTEELGQKLASADECGDHKDHGERADHIGKEL